MKTMQLFLFLNIAVYACGHSSPERHQLIALKKMIPTIVCDIKYATKDNFTGQQIYESSDCYLLASVAKALANVQKELQAQGLGLKIWDGYRPLAAQWKLWHIVPDERYVSNPAKGGRHCRGTAVDVTLVDLKTGKELVMPTGFDDFSERAGSQYEDLPADVKARRKLLQDVMIKHGFTTIKSEWWHFDYKGWQDCESLDLSFKEIAS